VRSAAAIEPLPPGMRFGGRLVYLESAAPLRALVLDRGAFEEAENALRFRFGRCILGDTPFRKK
jgi:hypothetical protein